MAADDAWYFAYGANMASRVLSGRRGVRPTSSEAATLDGFELVFDLRGIPPVEPGFASIRAAEGQMEGVLHRLSKRDLHVVELTESKAYRWIDVEVEGRRSGRVVARTLQSVRSTDGLRPSRRYVALLVEGAVEHGLSEAWIDKLRTTPSAYVPIVSPLVELFPSMLFRVRRGLRAISRRR
jgi:hypothetical protein